LDFADPEASSRVERKLNLFGNIPTTMTPSLINAQMVSRSPSKINPIEHDLAGSAAAHWGGRLGRHTLDDSNESWPFVSLTEYGEQYVVDQRVTPLDRSQYLARMNAIAALDDVEERYVGQSLEAYVRSLPDAAAVMIGAASEHLLTLVLTDIASRDATS
jgi:hypothetical protein